MEIKIILNDAESDQTNIYVKGMLPIMQKDIRPKYIKCNPLTVDRIKKSGLRQKGQSENRYAGMQLIESKDLELNEVIIESE